MSSAFLGMNTQIYATFYYLSYLSNNIGPWIAATPNSYRNQPTSFVLIATNGSPRPRLVHIPKQYTSRRECAPTPPAPCAPRPATPPRNLKYQL